MANAASRSPKSRPLQTDTRPERDLRYSAEVVRKKCTNLLHQHRFYMNQAAGLSHPRCALRCLALACA